MSESKQMSRGTEQLSRPQPQDDGLESYRRLIELQKQMIELSQQHEQSKRECNALREQVAREVANRLRARRTWRHRLQQSASNLLKRMPRFTAVSANLEALSHKQTSLC